jgi:hypothetical protein
METEKKKNWSKDLTNAGIDSAIALGAGIVSLQVLRKAPAQVKKYIGFAMFGSGILGLVFASGKYQWVKVPAAIVASLGGIHALNVITSDNGIPAITGWKGTVNKVIPQLSGMDGISFRSMGNVERMNEALLLGEAAQGAEEGDELIDDISGPAMGSVEENLMGAM